MRDWVVDGALLKVSFTREVLLSFCQAIKLMFISKSGLFKYNAL